MNPVSHSESRLHVVTRAASCIGLLVAAAWLASLLFVLSKGKLGEGVIVFLVSLPFVAWIANFSIGVLFAGRLPVNPSWPFASNRVLLVYIALVPIVLRAVFG